MIIVKIILFFGILIFIHELGHFLVAKAVGVRVETFSLGFGPRILGFTRANTDYRLSLIPLGGYVKMAGQYDIPDEESMLQLKGEPWEFPSKTWWQRFLVVSAGSIMNILLALVVFTLVALLWGSPIFESIVKIGVIDERMPEYNVFQVGDLIETVGGQKVTSWNDVYDLIGRSADKPISCEINRADERLSLTFTPKHVENERETKKIGRIGLKPYLEPLIGEVFEDHPASKARLALLPGDRILSVDEHELDQWYTMRDLVAVKPDIPVTFMVERSFDFQLKVLSPDVEIETNPQIPGIIIGKDNVVTHVIEQSAAYLAGFIEGDRIISITTEKIPLWKKMLHAVSGHHVQHVMIVTISRSKPFTTTIVPLTNPFSGEGYIGISNASADVYHEVGRERIGGLTALKIGVDSTIFYSQIIFITIKKLLTHDVSVDNLAGPVGITQMIGKQAESGLKELLEFLAILSVNLGIVNFFPIPVLDGGLMVVLLVEGVRRRPLTLKMQIVLQKIGLLILLPLILYVTYNDIARWLGQVLRP